MSTSGRVLIIDDEAPLRQTFTRMMRQIGCEVSAAGDGVEGLQILAGATYDLVYLDIHLPGGLDGLQVLKEMMRLYPTMPVVLLTAHASLQSAIEALRLGATDYLVKPIDPDTLLARTRVILAEQTIVRRRRELVAHIETLQHELKTLDEKVGNPEVDAAAALHPLSTDRFLKRGTLILDLQARRVTFGERVLLLPPAAFDYLAVLVRHMPEVVPYQTLVVEAQGYQTDLRQAQELAKWHIHELREALEPQPAQPHYVLNLRGVGYRLVVD